MPEPGECRLKSPVRRCHQCEAMRMNKDPTLMSLVERLCADLSVDVVLVDHWVADRCAIGVARRSDPRFLVYIALSSTELGLVSFELERPPVSGDLPYDSDGMVDGADYRQLLDAAQCHLQTGAKVPTRFPGQKVDGHRASIDQVSRNSDEWVAKCTCGWSNLVAGKKLAVKEREGHLDAMVKDGAALQGGGREAPSGPWVM